MKRGKRVFQDEIGDWPEVYQTGPNSYEVVARHVTPRKIQKAGMYAFIPPVLLTFYLLPMTNQYNWGFVFVGVLLGSSILFSVTRNILSDLPFLTSSTARIYFENGAIRWDKHTIPAGAKRAIRTVRHRLAEYKLRTITNERDKRNPIYEISSEVIIDTGPSLMHARLVAEIGNDDCQERGMLLVGTLRLVDEQLTREVSRAETQKKREVID